MHISFCVDNTYISNTDLESCWVSEESHNPKDLKFKINFFVFFVILYFTNYIAFVVKVLKKVTIMPGR